MREAVETIRAAVDAGARICVHGDYDADGICATALAVLLLRELGADVAWHLPSRFEEGYGLNAGHADAARRGGLRPRPDRRLRHHGRRRGRARARRSGSRSSSPTTTGPADAFPACPVVAPLEGRLSVRGALRHGRRLEARRGAARRRTTRSSSGTSTSSRSRPSPTSCRSSTRTARSRCSGCAGSRRRRSPACAR